MTTPRSSGSSGSSVANCEVEQRGGHEVAGAAGLAPRDHLAAALEVQELQAGDVVAQLVAVASASAPSS